jgi:NADP-dependent 3-hydroxy acid dehydrogenase YdfG/uncharacterized protein YciI
VQAVGIVQDAQTVSSESRAMLAIAWIQHLADTAAHVDAHRAYLASLHRRGKLVSSGPFSTRDGGCVVLRVRDEAEARALIEADPYAVAKVARHELRLWTPTLGDLATTRPLDGKAALVTGASSGIGEATALALARHGASVVLAARRRDRLDALSARIAEDGGTAVAVVADVTDEEQTARLVECGPERFGRLDIVVNSAGIMLLASMREATPSEWRRMIELNLLALMNVTRCAVPHLRASGGGHLVNIASLAGRVANPNASGYAATKFGVVGFSESVRREVYTDNIRVTVIEPGVVATELGEHIENPAMKENLRARAAQMEPLRADDIAEAVVYAVTQPARVNVNEIVVRPTGQER